MGVRRTPALRLSDSAGAPMLVGLIRPAILLPTETARSCTDGDLFAMLLHELAHIRRVDMAWMWLHQLALILFYFNPAVWLAGREMRRERELACDELVLSRSGISGHDYASGFLSALRLACGVSTSGTALAMAEPIELEKRRLAGMVSGRISRMTHNWLLGLLALVLIGLPTYIGLTPAIDWSAVRVQRVAGPSRAGTMLYFRHPMERQLGDITVSVTGVGRLVDPDPADVYPGETPYQGRLVVEVDARSGSTDMDLMGSNRGPTQLIVGGDELLQRLTFGGEAPMGRSRAQYWFALPARYASKLDRLTFPISYDPRTMPGHFGPFRLSDLSQPRRLKVGDETTLVMADTTEVTLPVGYVDFVKPWNDSDDSYGRPGRPRGGRYLVLRLYTWSHALDHVVLYDDDGRAIPMVEGTETSDAGSILHTSISTAAWDRAHDATDDAPWAPAYLGLQWAGMAWKMMPMPGIDPARVAGMVCTVDPNGPAAKAGIRVGDGLVRMTTKNQIPFGPEVVQDSAGSFADPGVPLRVTILRGGDERTVTLTPARDPMFEGVIERSRSALAKLNMEMPDCRSDRISTYVFVSNSPVRAGLRASKLELWFTGNPATPRDQWREEQVTFRDIPLPKEFWAIQDARSGKSHLPR